MPTKNKKLHRFLIENRDRCLIRFQNKEYVPWTYPTVNTLDVGSKVIIRPNEIKNELDVGEIKSIYMKSGFWLFDIEIIERKTRYTFTGLRLSTIIYRLEEYEKNSS